MRCGIVGMSTHSVEAGWGNPPTIAHVPKGIVHGLPLAEALLEKVPSPGPFTSGGHREREHAALRAPRGTGGDRFGFAGCPGQTHVRAQSTKDKPALVQEKGP